MTSSQWGFAGRVGAWEGVLEVPAEERRKPITAAVHLLDRFIPLLRGLHRPRRIILSWGEYDAQGEQVEAHEEVESAVADWDAVRRSLAALENETSNQAALMSIFIDLDTSLLEASDESWCEGAATFQISMTPPWLEPGEAGVGYVTFIDVWLSTTYDSRYVPRSNRDAAELNRPRLERFLKEFAAMVGASFRIGHSQLYPFAITSTGFGDVDDLPPRSSERS